MRWKTLFLAFVLWAMGWTTVATACPFCSAVSQTLAERINTSDAAVLVELVELAPQASDASAPVSNEAVEAAKSTFKVLKVYRGEPQVKVGDKVKALYLGKAAPGSKSLLTGLEPKAPQWTLPVELSPRAVDYLEQVLKLPLKGTERLDFCENYLEDSETLLQEDALNEFAMADYPTIRQASAKYDHDQIMRWIQNSATPETRRRLYFTLLGACGTPKDVEVLEGMIRSGDPVQMRGLDALLACYLTLGGPSRMPLLEELFLKNKTADYTQTYAAIMAIRFHGQQADIIPQKRAVEALRHMLDRPQLADLVIPDLARWEDWDSVDKLVELFKTSTKEWSYVRVPIINYLRACPRPEAKARLEELAKLDPDSFKRAATFFPFSSGPAVKPDGKKGEKKTEQTDPKKDEKPIEKQPATSSAARQDDAGDVALNIPSAAKETERVAEKITKPRQLHGGDTIALVMGTEADAATPPPATKGDHYADAVADPEEANAGPIGAVIAPAKAGAISDRWLKVLVGGVPIAAGLMLFGILWGVLRLPKQNYVDEVGP